MSTSNDRIFLDRMLEEEYKRLHGELPPEFNQAESTQQNDTDQSRVTKLYGQIHKLSPPRSALCLSGGGIRSGTFALGVLQGLARHGLLDKFDYLSTVSGGGYVGGWLTAWLHHREQNLAGVSKELGGRPGSPLDPEPQPLKHLRAYSNYLTPKLGLLSADTAAFVATYLRNLLLNWLVIIPLFAAVLAVPRLCVAIVGWSLTPVSNWLPFALWGGFGLGVIAVAYITCHIPSANSGSRKTGFWRWLAGQGGFICFCLTPVLLSAVFLTTYWAWYRNLGRAPYELETFFLFGVALHLLGWFLGVVTSLARDAEDWLKQVLGAWPRTLAAAPIVVIITGALGGLGAWAVATKLFSDPVGFAEVNSGPLNELREWYVCLAAPVFLLLFLAAAVVFVGFASRFTDDEDREWYSRFGAWLLLMLLLWAAGSTLVIFGPVWFLALRKFQTIVASLGGISGVVTALAGRSAKTAHKDGQPNKPSVTGLVLQKALYLSTLLFLVSLVVGVSLGASGLLIWMEQFSQLSLNFHLDAPWHADGLGHLHTIHFLPALQAAVFIGVLALFGIVMAWAVNINKFSMHALYRNRLIRAYLGASHTARRPNPFTGFDPKDNIQMHDLWPNPSHKNFGDRSREKLLHVVNMALNLVGGDDLAWQQRKAESFTVTPLHSGNYRVGYRRAGDEKIGKLHYGGKDGISLGTAITISGAAASPNMGYHSSSLIAFLMTFLNVRLGCWLGNTGAAGDKTFYLNQPRLMVRPLIAEALGMTNDRSPYIYLSDGGHFENLGLYEMVLRRCRIIVVSDASCDPEYKFEDLGNAVDKIRVDLGVPINFDDFPIRHTGTASGAEKDKYCALGHIRYSCVDGPGTDGVLIYLKPVLYGKEPRDVLAYSKSSPDFPHESTGDQWFSESQFESYRALGEYVIEQICEQEQWQAGSLDSFADKVSKYLQRMASPSAYSASLP